MPLESPINAILVDFPLSESQKEVWLSALRYGLYYKEIDVDGYKDDPRGLERLLIMILAESIDRESLAEHLSRLPLPRQLQIIADCIDLPREGSFFILQTLENITDGSLIRRLRTRFYDHKLLNKINIKPLNEIVNLLAEDARSKVSGVLKTLPSLIDSIIKAPSKGFEAFNAMMGVSKDNEPPAIQEQRVLIEKTQKELEVLFSKYIGADYPYDLACQFFEIFGLSGHIGGGYYASGVELNLDAELTQMSEHFDNPGFIPPGTIGRMIHFVESLCSDLHTFCFRPEAYLQGLLSTAYAVPTAGKPLNRLHWISSVAFGIDSLLAYLRSRSILDHTPVKVPIIVFDQSLPELFSANGKYIAALKTPPEIVVWHVSSKQTLELANRLRITEWIAGGRSGDSFGFGGARNAVMFMAPVIRKSTLEEIESFDQLMSLPDQTLHQYFEAATLGKGGEDLSIYMGDDDVYVPECNIYADTQFAADHQSNYYVRYSACIGRSTMIVNSKIASGSLLKNPAVLFYSTCWVDAPTGGGMKGRLTKPTFCLPLPFGNEENHVELKQCFNTNFEQPIVHLSGTRFPNNLNPKSPLDGIANYLRGYIPYVFGIILSANLIDSLNKYGKSILPWNRTGEFDSLGSLLAYAKSQPVLTEIMNGFWKNFRFQFATQEEGRGIAEFLESLVSVACDVSTPEDLNHYYIEAAEDAKYCLLYAKRCLELHDAGESTVGDKARRQFESDLGVDITSIPLTQALYTMVSRMEAFVSIKIQRGKRSFRQRKYKSSPL